MKMMFRCMVAGLPLLLSAAVVEEVQVPSPAMNKDVPASVVLPAKYAQDPGAAWPVVYVVHGAGGNHRTYATAELTYLADQYGFILVCADGGKTSWWFDSPIDPTYKYETHVTKELVPWIDAHYRTYATRTQRAIMGGSMGGHGACWLGFRHKDLFGAVGSIYGGLDLWEFPKQWDISKRLGPRDEFPERWRTYSAYTEGAKLKNGDVEFIQMVGTSDFFLKANRKMHEILVSNKVEHTYIEMRTDQEKTSGHSGEFNALCKPIFASFFRNYFDTGKGQIAQGVHARTTRYGVKVAKKVRGMTARPQVELPAPWKIVEGDEGLTGCDVRDFYFTIEAPGENTPAPVVKIIWPGVAVNGVYGARDVTIADEAVTFTPTARKAPLTYATGWQEGALSMLYHHHVEGAQHGPYAGRPLPMNEIRAGDNWRAAARAMFARAGLGETNATDGALIRLYGFDSNFPNRHVDHPPHFHVMLEWNGFRNNNVGHYVLDPDGRIRVNNFLVCGRVPGYDREGYFKQVRGETTAYNGPSGRTVFTLEMLKDGSGLILRRPGQVREWMISGENPVEAVTVSARVSPYAPWTEVASYSVADDTVAGVLQITERTATAAKTERFVYNPDTGKLIETNVGR